MSSRKELPLVYSCSGSSNVAQLANDLAVKLDRSGRAEMSCIAGVGGDVPSLVRVAKSGRPIVVIDGCPLECARACLRRHGIEPTAHHQLADYGLRKRQHEDFPLDEAADIYESIVANVATLRGSASGPSSSFDERVFRPARR